MLTHTYPHKPLRKIKVTIYIITRLTANFMCGVMSDLVNWEFRKSMVIHDTECPYWDQVPLNNTNQTKPNLIFLYPKPQEQIFQLQLFGVNSLEFPVDISFHFTFLEDKYSLYVTDPTCYNADTLHWANPSSFHISASIFSGFFFLLTVDRCYFWPKIHPLYNRIILYLHTHTTRSGKPLCVGFEPTHVSHWWPSG